MACRAIRCLVYPFGITIAFATTGMPALAQPAAVPYESAFAAAVGPEWSRSDVFQLSDGTRVLGRFTNQTVTLTLDVDPGVPHALVFDLYCLDSWDGNNRRWGPDWFIVTIDGRTVLRETFGTWSNHSFPGWPAVWNMALGGSSRWVDDVYYNMFLEFTPESDSVTISFRGQNLQRSSDESWALDRVRVLPLADAEPLRPLFREVGRQIGFGNRRTNSINNGSGKHWADLNADGFLDCFVTGDQGSLVLWNLGGGRFVESPIRHSGRSLVRQAALVDVNGDAMLDIVGVPSNYDTVVALTNDGDSSFTELEEPIMPSPRNTEALAVLDLNRDGRPDVLALSGSTGNWAAMVASEPDAPPTEARGSEYGFGDAGRGSYGSVADANGDGIPDLFYHLSTGMLILSQPDNRWQRHDQDIRSDALNSHKAGSAWADFDNDGQFDLFVPDPRSGQTGRLWRNLGGSFVDVTRQAGLDFPARQRSAAWGDFDNDGHLDLYIACEEEPAALFRNRGDGTFERTPNEIAQCTTSGDAHHAVWVDYNNDGNLDLAIADRKSVV